MNKQIDDYDILLKRNKKSPWIEDPGRDYNCSLNSSNYGNWPQALCCRFECANCGTEMQRNRINEDDIEPVEGDYDIAGELVGIRINNCICKNCGQKHNIEFNINNTIGWNIK